MLKMKKIITLTLILSLTVQSSFAAEGTFSNLINFLKSYTHSNDSNLKSESTKTTNEEHKTWLDSLEISLEKGTWHPLDSFGLLLMNTFPLSTNNVLSPTSIRFKLSNSSEVIEDHLIGDFAASTHSNYNRIPKFNLSSESDIKLSLHYKNDKIHEFIPSVAGALVYGDYLVFIEKNNYAKSSKSFVISFIDLAYFVQALGKTNLPIFQIPIHTNSDALTKFEIENGMLAINDFKLNEQMIREGFAEPQRIAFNMTAAALEIRNFQEMDPFLEKLVTSFVSTSKINQSEQEKLNQLINGTTPYDNDLNKIVNSIATENSKTQTLIGSISGLFFQLSAPRPLGATNIIAALVHTAKGLRSKKWSQTKEGLTQLSQQRLVKWGGPIVAAAFLGTMYPEPVSEFLYQGLDITRVILEQTYGRLHDLTILGHETMSATFSGIKPQVIYSAYLTPDKLPKLAVGFTAILAQLYLALGVPHLIINSIKLGKDLSQWDWTQYECQSKFKKLKLAFIDRQNQEQSRNIELLTDEVSKKTVKSKLSGESNEENPTYYSEELNQQAIKLIFDNSVYS
jgi:hypothetical protein